MSNVFVVRERIEGIEDKLNTLLDNDELRQKVRETISSEIQMHMNDASILLDASKREAIQELIKNRESIYHDLGEAQNEIENNVNQKTIDYVNSLFHQSVEPMITLVFQQNEQIIALNKRSAIMNVLFIVIIVLNLLMIFHSG
jgi:ElaB/YqjD/DUF883 family membrane-anchored ribosome-binding protein